MGVFDAFQIPWSALEREHEEAIARASAAGAGIVIRGGVARGAPTEWERARPTLPVQDRWEPAKLDELVPNYLPAAPLDPFALTPQPLKYIADPAKPRLYSVGEDGADNAGSEQVSPSNARRTKLSRWEKLDAVVHLTAQPRERAANQSVTSDQDRAPPATSPGTAPVAE